MRRSRFLSSLLGFVHSADLGYAGPHAGLVFFFFEAAEQVI